MEEVLALTRAMELGRPASETVIAEAERALGMRLPPEYVEFLGHHNGGEGAVGDEGWARFIPVEEIVEENALCAELDHLAGRLLFGGNGGGEAFVFDGDGTVFVVPWVGGREDAIPQGRFPEFVRRLAEGSTFERDRS